MDRTIIAAARTLFCRHGFAETTIDAIAALCGTTRRSIYHRHDDKEALFAVVCELHCSEFNQYVLAAEMDDDHVLALRNLCWRMMSCALKPENAAFHSHCSGEIGLRPALAKRVVQLNDALESEIERRILTAQRDGFFQRFSAAALATVLVGVMLSNPINRAIMGDEQFADPHSAELYFSENWAIFLAMA